MFSDFAYNRAMLYCKRAGFSPLFEFQSLNFLCNLSYISTVFLLGEFKSEQILSSTCFVWVFVFSIIYINQIFQEVEVFK